MTWSKGALRKRHQEKEATTYRGKDKTRVGTGYSVMIKHRRASYKEKAMGVRNLSFGLS